MMHPDSALGQLSLYLRKLQAHESTLVGPALSHRSHFFRDVLHPKLCLPFTLQTCRTTWKGQIKAVGKGGVVDVNGVRWLTEAIT